MSKQWWTEAEEAALLAKNKADVLKAFSRAEKLPKPKLSEMFNDVWAVPKGEEIPAAIVSRRSPALERSMLTHRRQSREQSSAGCSRSMATSGHPGGKNASDLSRRVRMSWTVTGGVLDHTMVLTFDAYDISVHGSVSPCTACLCVP